MRLITSKFLFSDFLYGQTPTGLWIILRKISLFNWHFELGYYES